MRLLTPLPRDRRDPGGLGGPVANSLTLIFDASSRLWRHSEALGRPGVALGRLWEGLEEPWGSIYTKKLPINRTAAVMLRLHMYG